MYNGRRAVGPKQSPEWLSQKKPLVQKRKKSTLHSLETIGDNSDCQRKDTIYVLAGGTRESKFRLLKKGEN